VLKNKIGLSSIDTITHFEPLFSHFAIGIKYLKLMAGEIKMGNELNRSASLTIFTPSSDNLL